MTALELNDRWLPPSPHKEELLKFIEKGRAHVEERGHGVPPVVVFEDGGMIELPKVRYEMTRRGRQFVAADESGADELTKFSDVCGTIDELKGLLKEQPEMARTDPGHLMALLDHIGYMLSRMQRRREAYRNFLRDVTALSRQMAAIEGPDVQVAYEKVEEMRAMLRNDPSRVADRQHELYALAEDARDIANRLEKCLGAHKEVAIALGELHDSIKGGRSWKRKVPPSP